MFKADRVADTSDVVRAGHLSGPIDHLPFHGDRHGDRDRQVAAPR
jgi:hypothetical protein